MENTDLNKSIDNDLQKRHTVMLPDWLLTKMRHRAKSLGMTLSGYIRYMAIKDLEKFEQEKQ